LSRVFRVAVSQDVVEAVNLLAQGKRNYMCGEVGHAVSQLQQASRLLYDSIHFWPTVLSVEPLVQCLVCLSSVRL